MNERVKGNVGNLGGSTDKVKVGPIESINQWIHLNDKAGYDTLNE